MTNEDLRAHSLEYALLSFIADPQSNPINECKEFDILTAAATRAKRIASYIKDETLLASQPDT